MKRVKAISTQIDAPVAKFLDVGCNRGLTAKYLLDSGKALHATGIEYEQSTVDEKLLSDRRFSLITGDLAQLSLTEEFDAIFYGAVHHHVLRQYGLGRAIEVFHHLISHCNSLFFFETGHITEGGRWPWQRAVRRYFRTDEEHYFYLLRSIEPRIESFKVLGKFWIHSTRRWLTLIKLKRNGTAYPDFDESIMAADLTSGTRLYRTFGSNRQSLADDRQLVSDSPSEYFKLDHINPPLFIKRHLHLPIANHLEYWIGRETPFSWAVRPLGRTSNGSLVFPLVKGTSLSDCKCLELNERREISEALMRIARQISELRIYPPPSFLLPIEAGRTLNELVDINPNNILFDNASGNIQLQIIDLEMHSNHNGWRNKIHLAKTMFKLKSKQFFATGLLITGYAQGAYWLLAYQFAPVEKRIINRQPSLLSLIIADLRTHLGTLLSYLLPSR